MKLSTAISRGNKLKEPDSSQWLSPDMKRGCALGGALLALGLGKQFLKSPVCAPAELTEFKVLYPWLTSAHEARISGLYREDNNSSIKEVISYVRSVEPDKTARRIPK